MAKHAGRWPKDTTMAEILIFYKRDASLRKKRVAKQCNIENGTNDPQNGALSGLEV